MSDRRVKLICFNPTNDKREVMIVFDNGDFIRVMDGKVGYTGNGDPLYNFAERHYWEEGGWTDIIELPQ